MLRKAKQGDLAWLVILLGVVAFELTANDLLSESSARAVDRFPIATRLAIAAIAGHLACVIPPAVDVFSAKNIAHQWAVAHFPFARPDRLAKAA
jgi:hypothetical protein